MQWWGLYPPSKQENVDISNEPINAFSVGRTDTFNNASYTGGPCPAYITGSPGCTSFSPTLASAPSSSTQLLFTSAGGNRNRYYIQVQSRVAAGCSMSYIGMDKSNCAIETTQLYTLSNSSASLVWMIESVSLAHLWQLGFEVKTEERLPTLQPTYTNLQVAPDPPIIDSTSIKGTTLYVMVVSPAYAGFSGETRTPCSSRARV